MTNVSVSVKLYSSDGALYPEMITHYSSKAQGFEAQWSTGMNETGHFINSAEHGLHSVTYECRNIKKVLLSCTYMLIYMDCGDICIHYL